MVITIDGPAGAGKSSVASQLARRLGFEFLDTGAMYRSVAWLTLEKDIQVSKSSEFEHFVSNIDIDIRQSRIWINGYDVTTLIRSASVTERVSEVADHLGVRQRLAGQQREIASGGNFVCEGRDQGTEVFPDSRCKFFLTASDRERARRRADELRQRGDDTVDEQVILDQQIERDARDISRPVGGLRQAEDAIVVKTDGLSFEQVVEQLESVAREKLGLQKASSPND